MPIEFRCSSCNKPLRVPETAVGKRAKCPGCQQTVTVPEASTIRRPPAGTPQQPAGSPPPVGVPPVGARSGLGRNPSPGTPQAGAAQGGNPYAAPTIAATPRGDQLTNQGTGRLEAGRAVSVAWALFKEHAGVLIGSFVVIMAASLVIQTIQQVVQTGALLAFGPPARGGGLNGAQLTALMVTALLFFVISQVVQIYLTTGLINLQLRIARGQQVSFGTLFSGGRWFLKTFLTSMLLGIVIFLGLIAFIVPGVYLALRYWTCLHFIVDKDCGVMESLKLASAASRGNMGGSFLLFLIGMGLVILGFIMLCFGIIVTAPVCFLSLTISYLMMTAQRFKEKSRV